MRFNDIFSARSIAAMLTSDPTNAEPYVGEAFFPRKKKMGIDLKWIKSHKGAGVELKPSSYDALATIRPREGFSVLTEEMPLFRESMKISEKDMADIQRAQDANDPYLMDVISRIYDDVSNLVEGANVASERMRMSLLAPINGDMKINIGTIDNTVYNYNYDADVSDSRNYPLPEGAACSEAYDECSCPDHKFSEVVRAAYDSVQTGVHESVLVDFLCRLLLCISNALKCDSKSHQDGSYPWKYLVYRCSFSLVCKIESHRAYLSHIK